MTRRSLLILMAILAMLLPASGILAQGDEVVFGVILVGPHNDHGWSEAHYSAGLYVEENVPGARMVYFESLNAADAPETTLEMVVSEMVAEGAQVVFTASDEFEEDTLKAAESFPDITFISISGDDALAGEAPANMGNLMGNMTYGKMMAGCAAALASETGKIGYLGPLINSETRRLASSVYLGAQSCWDGAPEDLEVSVTWIGFWFNIPGFTLDPTEETQRFLDGGADVVISGIDTTEALVVSGQRAAEGDVVWAVPYDYEDACAEAPDICLGVPAFNWGSNYVEVIAAVVDGSYEQSWVWDGPNWDEPEMSAVTWIDGPGLSEEQSVTLAEFAAMLDETNPGRLTADNIDDEGVQLGLWVGPLNLQDGTVLAEEGEIVPAREVWYLEQLLEGMIGDSVAAE